MELGEKIKQMRHQKNLTQEELADRCELTKGYISQLENNLNSPSIATLTDILSALGSSLAEFFKEEKDEKVVFSKEEFIEKESDGVLFRWLIPNAQKNMMEPVFLELAGRRFHRRGLSSRRRRIRVCYGRQNQNPPGQKRISM